MAHFAKLGPDNEVLSIVVVNNEDMTDEDGNEVEQKGIDLLSEVTGYSKWIQTSYNHTFRVKQATEGDVYNESLDCFHAIESPFPSWSFSDSTCKWEASVPYPDDGKDYEWMELTKQWVKAPLVD